VRTIPTCRVHTVLYGDLKFGDCFCSDDCLWIKTAIIGEHEGTAIELESGEDKEFQLLDHVVPVETDVCWSVIGAGK